MNAHVMVTPAEVAARDGVTKQAVTKAVRDMAAKGTLEVERDSRGRIVRFAQAQYDHHRGQYRDPVKAPAKPVLPDNSESLDEARRRAEWLKVDREMLRRDEALGKLVRADMLGLALEQAGRKIQAIVARLQNRADDLALAVSKEGAHGLRVKLREASFDLNSQIAKELAEIGAAAPEKDPRIEEADAA